MGDARNETFEVGGDPKVELKNLASGHASFLPGEDGEVVVVVEGRHAEEFEIRQSGDTIILRAPDTLTSRWNSFEVRVRMPAGTELAANVASADVDIEVDVAKLGFNSASGDVRVKGVEGGAGVNTASGDVGIESVGGNLGVNTASGNVRVREAKGNLGVNTASGDLRVESALADVGFSSASGDLEVGRYGGESLECQTHSGDVKIAVPPGRTLEVDMNTLSGDIRNGLGEAEGEGNGATARLRVKTLSGDITLARA